MAQKTGTLKSSGPKRNIESKNQIVAAAIHILETQGYTKFSIEQVARKAGVGKQTIYRWWPTKPELILDIFSSELLPPIPSYDGTSSLQEHLKKYLFIFAENLSAPAATQAFICLIAEKSVNPKFSDLCQKLVFIPRMKALSNSFKLATSLKEISHHEDTRHTASMIYGPVFHTIFVANSPVTIELVDTVIDRFFAGLKTN